MAKKREKAEVLAELIDYKLRQDKASLYRGQYIDAEFYYNERGVSISRNAYDTLTKEEKAKLLFNIRIICDSAPGTLHPKTVSNIEDKKEGIIAVKYSGQGRMASFNCSFVEKGILKFEKPKLIVTNRYIKKTQQNSKKEVTEISKAIESKKSYLDRIKNKEDKKGKKNYYELLKKQF